MKKFSVFILVALFMNGALFGQEKTLEGKVTNKKGNPVSEVTVMAEGTDINTSTDNGGYYLLEKVPESVKTLVFNHPDMKTKHIGIENSNVINVTMDSLKMDDLLDLSLEDLLNIEITTASKTSEKQSDAPGVISVITKDELQMFGGTTLKDILERVPSLISSTVYMTDRSTIASRGDQVPANSSHVLLLINGRPVRESLEGGIKSEMYEAFPVNIIEKIEVIRGPGSVLYGSNAFSAVINVITDSESANSFGVTGMGGVPGNYGTMAKAKVTSGELDIVVAGRYLKKDDWETDWSYAIPAPTPHDTTIRVSNPDKSASAFVDIKYKKLRLMTSYNQWETGYYIADYAFLFPSYGTAKWTKNFVDLGYDVEVSDSWNMSFNTTYTRSTFDVSSWPGSSRKSYEILGDWANFVEATDKLGIVFGGSYIYFYGNEFVPGLGDISDDSRNSFGLFTQIDYQLLDNLKLIGGVQANKVEGIDISLVPRLGMIYYLMPKLNAKILYSEAFRAPSINELTLDFPDMHGNPDLIPEKVRTLDVGFNYQGEQVQLGINYFNTKQLDIIFQDRSGSTPIYNNSEGVSFSGIELEGKYYANRNVFITGSMLYQNNEDKDGNENVTPIANLGIKMGFGYRSDNGFTVSIFNVYQSKLDERFKSQLNPTTGSYNMMNMHLEYNFAKGLSWEKTEKCALFIQVDNLLDKELWLPDWGLTPGKTMPVKQGRAIYFGLSVGL